MAVSHSVEHVERLNETSVASDLVERLTAEGLISMKQAAALYGRKTHKSTPTRHHLHGVKLPNGTVIRLEAIRVSGSLVTSRAAVLRFFAAQNESSSDEVRAPAPPAVTPAARRRDQGAAADRASAIFGARS